MRRMYTKDEIIDIAEEHGGGGGGYTAGTGIDITNKTISVDTDVIATVDYVDESVTGFVTEDEVDDKLEDYQPKLTAGSGISISSNTISVNNTIATQTDLQQGLATRMPLGAVSGTYDGTDWSTIQINGVTKNIPSGGGSTVYRHYIEIYFNDESSVTLQTFSSSSTSVSTVAQLSTLIGQYQTIPATGGIWSPATEVNYGVTGLSMLPGQIHIDYIDGNAYLSGKNYTQSDVDSITDTVNPLM